MSEKSKINRKKRREHEEKEAKNVIKYIFIALIILGLLSMASFFFVRQKHLKALPLLIKPLSKAIFLAKMQPLELEQKATNRSSPSSPVQSMEGFLAMNLRKKLPTKRPKIYSNCVKVE